MKSDFSQPARPVPRRAPGAVCAALLALVIAGCGTTKSQTATEQLLVSDAVDRSISEIDFRALAGRKVFFDTQYIQPVKGAGFVNSEYIISSLRQQMFAANLLLQENVEDADYVVEARVGALGMDSHDVVYGVPASNGISSAATLVPNAPNLPAIPEIALAKRNEQLGAAKVGVFAYDRRTRAAVWQSGISRANSTARDFWVFGAGPFQRGTIYDGTHFAGSDLPLPAWQDPELMAQPDEAIASYAEEAVFEPLQDEPAAEEKATSAGSDAKTEPGRLQEQADETAGPVPLELVPDLQIDEPATLPIR